jgi:glycosyltransferase involved in cell wall biosynthesis
VNWADEVIVIDSGSRDSTVDIARASGARVVFHPWQGFVHQRRFALSQAANDWVLSIDADEVVTEELRRSIQSSVGKSRFNGYVVQRLNHFWGKPIKHCGWHPDMVLRCFRKSTARLADVSIHEGFDVEGDVDVLDGYLLHYSYDSLKDYFEKMNRYTSLEVMDKKRRMSNKRLHGYDLIFHSISRFLRMYFIRKGFLDGFAGLIVCTISTIYLFVLYAKMWETQRQ